MAITDSPQALNSSHITYPSISACQGLYCNRISSPQSSLQWVMATCKTTWLIKLGCLAASLHQPLPFTQSMISGGLNGRPMAINGLI